MTQPLFSVVSVTGMTKDLLVDGIVNPAYGTVAEKHVATCGMCASKSPRLRARAISQWRRYDPSIQVEVNSREETLIVTVIAVIRIMVRADSFLACENGRA